MNEANVTRRTLSVLVENAAGVLSQVSRLFSRKGYNIESLAVGTTDDPAVSRITIEVWADKPMIEQIMNQLRKQFSVYSVQELLPERSIRRELVMFKVRAETPDIRNEIIQIANIFRASIIDVSLKSLTLALIGDETKADAMQKLLEAFGILELVRTGMVATDLNIAQMLQRSNVPVIVCVNKCDTLGDPPADFYEFYNLGLGDPIQVSSVHGHGTGDLLDAVLEHLPEEKEEEDEGEIIKVAVIGKPNVGKSSLVNRVSGENRCIVSNIAGTTRDAVDTTIENKYGVFTFIDTAGLRRKSKVEDSIEHYSNLRAEMAVDRADVCVILIDATVGFTEQDSKVAGIAHEAGKGCIIAVNKWDAVEKDDKTMQEYKTKLEKDFSFMSYAPIIFISAQTGQRLDRLFELIHKVASSNAMRITTGTLNDILAQATARVQPPTDKGKRLKIYYMTQASTRPPTVICFVNSKELFHFSYQRYLENRIREIFSLEGTPVRMIVRERGDKE